VILLRGAQAGDARTTGSVARLEIAGSGQFNVCVQPETLFDLRVPGYSRAPPRSRSVVQATMDDANRACHPTRS